MATGKAKREPARFDVALELLASVIWHLRGSVDVRLINSPHGLVVVIPGAAAGADGLPVVAKSAEELLANASKDLPVVANEE